MLCPPLQVRGRDRASRDTCSSKPYEVCCFSVTYWESKNFVVTFYSIFFPRHAEVMKKIIETVAEGGGELGVHMYPFSQSHLVLWWYFSVAKHHHLARDRCRQWRDNFELGICPRFFLNFEFQVSFDFFEICPSGHSHNRIRLHKALHHVAWSREMYSSNYQRILRMVLRMKQDEILLWSSNTWGVCRLSFEMTY